VNGRAPDPYEGRRALARPGGGAVPDHGPEANSRLTAMTAVVLLALLAVEGFTLLRLHSLLWLHVFIGTLLVPPVLLKVASTGYRFARYYLGSPAYRRKGPPPPLLRVLGPVVVVSTLGLIFSGVALMFVGTGLRSQVLFLHRATFILWFGAMAVHVLGHGLETARLAPRDWARRARHDVPGAPFRQWAVAASVVLGVPVGLLLATGAGSWHI
jgi:hypothetical protein